MTAAAAYQLADSIYELARRLRAAGTPCRLVAGPRASGVLG